MNRTSLTVDAAEAGESSVPPEPAASELAAAGSWLSRIELASRCLPRLPGLAAALHWLGLQLAAPLSASRFQVWQIHDWRDGAGLVQPWLASDDQAGVQRIDLAQLDLLREGEGALGLALSTRQAAVAPARGPAGGQQDELDALDRRAGRANVSRFDHVAARSASARLCLAVGLHDAEGEPFAALEWWMDVAPADEALTALSLLARLVAVQAPAWLAQSGVVARDGRGAGPPVPAHEPGGASGATAPRPSADPAHELAIAMATVLPVSLLLLDTELNVLLVNRHAQREFGLLPEQASGQGLAQLFGTAAGQDLAAGAAQSSTRGGLVEQHLVFTTRQGPRRVLVRSSAISDVAGSAKLLVCQLLTPGRSEPRPARLDDQAGVGPADHVSELPSPNLGRGDARLRPAAPDAGVAAPRVSMPRTLPATLTSARAASVRLAPRAAAVQANWPPDAPPEVLVIDDHAVNQELMTQMLSHLGCRARSVGSAELGLADLSARAVDLVMMDIRMPGMDGIEALGWIRQGATQHYALRTPAALPVVAVTAHAVAGDADRCLAHGFDAYLAKPCRLEDLRLVLDGLLAWRPSQPDSRGNEPQPVRRPRPTETPEPSTPRQAGQTPQKGAPPSAAAPVINDIESTTQMGEGIPVFDQQALLRLRALDPSGQNQLLVRVMKAFELSLQRLSSQLRTARQQQDVVAVRQAAHTLKSSSASVGALRLSGLCLDVETALRQAGATFEDTPASAGQALGEPVDRLIDEIDRVQATLPNWLAGLAPVQPMDRDPGTGADSAVN